MIDHMLFHNSYWINRTSDVQSRLANYDNLQNQLNAINGNYTFEVYGDGTERAKFNIELSIADGQIKAHYYNGYNNYWPTLNKE